MKRFRSFFRNQRGGAAIEFALAAPLLFTFVIGVSQLGNLFLANAGLQNAVSEGARLASIYPKPSDDAIIEAITSSHFPLVSTGIEVDPAIVHGTDDDGRAYAEISMSYKVPVDLIFFNPTYITLTETRRVYTQELSTEEPESTSSSGGGTSIGELLPIEVPPVEIELPLPSTSSSSSGGNGGNGNGSSSTSTSGGNGNASSSGCKKKC